MNTLLLKAAGFAAADTAMMTGVDWISDNPVDPMENLLIVASYYSIAMPLSEGRLRETLGKEYAEQAAIAAKVAYIAGIKMLVNLSEGRKLSLPSALAAAGITSMTRVAALALE